MEVDLHIHSRFSVDSRSRPEEIVRRASYLGLGAIAVTDHGTVAGSRAAAKLAPPSLLVVPGMELRTEKGDLLALFVESEVKSTGFSAAIDEIRSHGGVAIVPHPGASRRMTAQDIAMADGLEVFNSRLRGRENRASRDLGSVLGLPGFSSSDAHMIMEIGNGTTVVPEASTLEDLRKVVMRSPKVSKTTSSNAFIHTANSTFLFLAKGVWRRL